MIDTISRDDLRLLMAQGRVTVVDALPKTYYDQQHLPGAVNLVESDVDELAAALLPDRDAVIVSYCSNAACGNSTAVAHRLVALGYTDVRKYSEGIQDWVDAGHHTESTAAA